MEREELEVEDILQFRALARVGLMAEEEAHLTYQTTAAGGRVDEGGRPLSNRKTWWEWARGSSSADDAVMTADAVPESVNVGGEIKLSDEQRDKLAALLSGGADASASDGGHSAASAEYVEHTLLGACTALLDFDGGSAARGRGGRARRSYEA